MFRAKKGSEGYFLFSAATIAMAPKASSINAKEYSQLNENRYHAPPKTIKHKPIAIVLKELRSYFCGLVPRIAANAKIQTPKSTRTSGTVNVQTKTLVATSSMATTRIMKKTPMESSCRLLSNISLSSYYIVAPHSGQNLELAGIECPHLGQFIVAADGGVREVPHSGQNLDVAGT
jgi:hypothetical protein